MILYLLGDQKALVSYGLSLFLVELILRVLQIYIRLYHKYLYEIPGLYRVAILPLVEKQHGDLKLLSRGRHPGHYNLQVIN